MRFIEEEAVPVPRGRPTRVEVLDTAEGRFVIATYADGSVLTKAVDPTERPKRKPRKPIARARVPQRSPSDPAVERPATEPNDHFCVKLVGLKGD
jgi:hypothetical protein